MRIRLELIIILESEDSMTMMLLGYRWKIILFIPLKMTMHEMCYDYDNLFILIKRLLKWAHYEHNVKGLLTY